MSNVLPADTFIVVNKTVLSDKDRNVLMLLYQPIIGSQSISLYYTLWSYLDKSELLSNEWTHHHLLRDMMISNQEFSESKEKLEAIGLIKTYVKKGNINNYVYELNRIAREKHGTRFIDRIENIGNKINILSSFLDLFS